SASRKTCVSGDLDLDIFVLFPEEVERSELETRGLKIGKETFKHFGEEYRVEYAEHPYTKGEIDGYEVEIVPCYDTSPESIESAVDRTPHHSRWLEENLEEEHRKDVVVLKRFLEAAGIYGSSLKTEGFSGYLCEILVSEYGSFKELVESAIEWKEGEVIDPENQHEQLPEKLEKRFEDEPLVVIDPVDPERNVASVLSQENFSKFIYECWKFRNDPGINFFHEEEEEFTEFELKQELQNRGDFLVVEFDRPEAVEDVIYPQMRKTGRRLRNELEKNDFRIYTSGFHVAEETRLFFELDRELPETGEKKGPKVTHGEDHLAQFSSKYENVYVSEDRVCAKIEREYSDARKLLKDFLDADKEELEEKGIPNKVAEKVEDYSFTEPLNGSKRWLNHLGKNLHVNKDA
ncbi:MAG: CCA tRNA nucleotidyltransferase, partial [Candidatus Nanohaloarchaea archaeon]